LRFGARTFFRDALLSSLVLLAAGLAINYRTIWCQIQAAAIIVIAITALLCKERERKERVELGIKQQSLVYCLCCQRTSQTALTFGSRVALQQHESTIYEKLFVPVYGCSLMLSVWVIWVAYSALFHEGAHEAAVNQEIEVIFGFSEQLPPVLHTIRTFLLFMMAILSLFVNSAFSLIHMTVVLLCALLPPSTATAQTLTLGELTSRTALFCALFLIAESYEMNLRHNLWIRNARNERNTLLIAIQNAFKRDQEPLRARKQKPIDPQSVSIEVLSESEIGRSHYLSNSAAHLVTALRSCWILLVPREAVPLVITQIIIMLFLIYSERKKLEHDVSEGKLKPVYIEGTAPKVPSSSFGDQQQCLTSGDSASLRQRSKSNQPSQQQQQRVQKENDKSSILTKSKSITVTATTKTTTLAKSGEQIGPNQTKVSRIVRRTAPSDTATKPVKLKSSAATLPSDTPTPNVPRPLPAPVPLTVPSFPRVNTGALPEEIQQILRKNIVTERHVPKLLHS